ncbi:hypothetical protein [Chlorobium phaeovibrioides]|uniref:Uncharacterized protein n=1 Tax=Chlorobium phaeovibrioides TaxID=1094 RepID=A0ABW9UU66_CHLPH|nr:hypothetical protein [Chlorobium phaeovibrioides]MWV55274.1 hypothetical protein [Chlorobium phaeovibrioides]
MFTKGFNGIYRNGIIGIPPNMNSEKEPEKRAKDTRKTRPKKHDMELIHRAGHWLAYEVTHGNHRIDVIGKQTGFHSASNKNEVFRRFDDWAADEAIRQSRRADYAI